MASFATKQLAYFGIIILGISGNTAVVKGNPPGTGFLAGILQELKGPVHGGSEADGYMEGLRLTGTIRSRVSLKAR